MSKPFVLSALPGRFVLRRPVPAAILVLVLCGLAFAGIGKLHFDDGLVSFFRGDSAAFARYEDNRERFTPSQNAQAVLLTSDDFADAARLEAVREFTLELSFLDGVDAIHSAFSLANITASGTSEPLFPFDLDGADQKDLADLLRRAHVHPLSQEMLVSEDRTAMLVVLQVDFDHRGLDGTRAVLGEVKSVAADVLAGQAIAFEVTGLGAIRQVLIDSLYGDMIKLNLIGMTLGFVIGLIALRSVALAFLTALPSNLVLMWCLGIIGGTGTPIDTVNNVIPVLILVLTMSDSLHLTFELRRQSARLGAGQQAIANTVTKIGPACLLTSVTTAIAFATLLISQSEVIRSFGLVGTATTLIAVTGILALHPLVFLAASRFSSVRRLLESGGGGSRTVFGGGFLFRFGFRHPRAITALSLVFIVAAGSMHFLNQSNYSFLTLLNPSTPEIAALRQIEQRLAPTTSIDLPVAVDDGKAFSGEVLAELEKVHQALEDVLPGQPVFSLATLQQWYRGGGSRDGGSGDLEALFDELPEAVQRQFLSHDERYALIRVHAADQGAATTLPVLSKIEGAIGDLAVEHIGVLEPTGLLAMSAEEGSRMIRRLSISFAVAVLLTGVLVAVWFGNWRYGVFAALPNVFPILIVGAFLYAMGWQLEMSSSIALTIAFGIAVDDTIHVLNHLRVDAPLGKSYDRDLTKSVFARVAPVLVTTTAILSFGTLGTQFSDVAAVKYFGGLVIAIFILALLAVLLVLPAFWDAWRSREGGAKQSHVSSDDHG